MSKYIVITAFALILSGCATYYQKNLLFNNSFEAGNFQEAKNILDINKKKLTKKARNKVLYDLNYATTALYLGDNHTSIEYFKKADDYNESYSKNFGTEALSFITNPSVKPYKMEYFECVLLHFYQALNFIQINDYESAMVECRKMNLELNKQADDFKDLDKPRYSQDAFGHYLMGILYEITKNYNDAFIAYRNAIEIYENNYKKLFATNTPSYLKQALIRSAYKTGFIDEVHRLEKLYEYKYFKEPENKGRLIVFVLEGLSPIKSETIISFTGVKSEGGSLSFVSDDGVFSFPIFFDLCTDSERNTLNDLRFFKLALPKYSNRSRKCPQNSSIIIDNSLHNIYNVEDIEKIAHQSLQDRIWKELGSSIIRVALKNAVSKYASEKNEYVGFLLDITNAITEKADTRNWQTIPAQIKILDIPINEGQHSIMYQSCGNQYKLNINTKVNNTSFAIIKAY